MRVLEGDIFLDAPKAEVTGSNPVGCAIFINELTKIHHYISVALIALGERLPCEAARFLSTLGAREASLP